jgi:hypothetical protein
MCASQPGGCIRFRVRVEVDVRVRVRVRVVRIAAGRLYCIGHGSSWVRFVIC